MKQITVLFLGLVLLVSCKENNTTTEAVVSEELITETTDLEVKYAKGFRLKKIDHGYQLYITKGWQDHDYVIGHKFIDQNAPKSALGIRTPVKSIVPTSTTHIPAITALNEHHTIVAFPGLDYISSSKVREMIDKKVIEEIGQNQSLNVEQVIALQPDLVMGFSIEGKNPAYESIERASIPIIYNGDWLEEHPLGKAEWIKVFGILYGKTAEAQAIFNDIEREYLATKKLVSNAIKPTVIGGAMWKDVWYLPYGDSWQGKMIADAGGDYIYKETSGNGSLSYAAERVLKDARNAQYWIAPSQYTSYSDMQRDSNTYSLFDAFENQQVYTFSLTKGEKGGITYYEEASMRPDIVLKDLVKILHPEVALDHQLYFFKPLED